MAYEFPRYFSKNQATTQQPSVFAAESTEGQITEQKAKVAGVAQEGLGKIAKAYDDSRKSTAELNQRTEIADLLSRAEQADVNDVDKFLSENSKIHKANTSFLKDRPQDKEASAKAKYYKSTTDGQLKNIFFKKMIVQEQANTQKRLDLTVSNPVNLEGTIQRIHSELNTQREKGFIGDDDVYKFGKIYEEKARFNSFLNDANSDFDAAQQKLDENAYGLDAPNIEKAKKILDRNQKREIAEFKKLQFDNAVDAGTRLVDGTLTQNELQAMVVNGTMDPELAGAFEIALFAPAGDFKKYTKKNPPNLSGAYVAKAIKDMKSFDDETALKLVKGAMSEYTSTKPTISEKELAFIFKAVDEKRKNPDNPIWDHLKQATTTLPPTYQGAAFSKFMTRWNFSDDPRPVMQDAVNDTIKDADPRAVKFEIGKRYKYGTFLGFNPETGKARFEK